LLPEEKEEKLMKKGLCFLGVVILVVCVAGVWPLAARAEKGTETTCLMGCRPGVNACSNCCMDTFNKAQAPCRHQCRDEYNACGNNCSAAFEKCRKEKSVYACSQERGKCSQGCWNNWIGCDHNRCAAVQADFHCPDWVNPNQKCPYDCQVWNSASRSCVGAPMNGCK